MKVFGRGAAAIVAVLTVLPAAAAAAVPQKSAGKLPSNACKLLTLAQVQEVLSGATDGKPIHDKADKEEICNWEVDRERRLPPGHAASLHRRLHHRQGGVRHQRSRREGEGLGQRGGLCVQRLPTTRSVPYSARWHSS